MYCLKYAILTAHSPAVKLCWLSKDPDLGKRVCRIGVIARRAIPHAQFLAVIPLTVDRLVAVLNPIRYYIA